MTAVIAHVTERPGRGHGLRRGLHAELSGATRPACTRTSSREEGDARLRQAYPAATYERLAAVKRRVDPDERVPRQPQHPALGPGRAHRSERPDGAVAAPQRHAAPAAPPAGLDPPGASSASGTAPLRKATSPGSHPPEGGRVMLAPPTMPRRVPTWPREMTEPDPRSRRHGPTPPRRPPPAAPSAVPARGPGRRRTAAHHRRRAAGARRRRRVAAAAGSRRPAIVRLRRAPRPGGARPGARARARRRHLRGRRRSWSGPASLGGPAIAAADRHPGGRRVARRARADRGGVDRRSTTTTSTPKGLDDQDHGLRRDPGHDRGGGRRGPHLVHDGRGGQGGRPVAERPVRRHRRPGRPRATRAAITIRNVFPNTPAEEAGLQRGDQIVAVDGETTEGETLDETVSRVRGPEGEDGDPDDRPRRQGRLRRHDHPPRVRPAARELGDGPGHGGRADPARAVRHRRHRGAQGRDHRRPRTHGATGIVFDLRANPGGYVDEAVGVASQFVRRRDRVPGDSTATARRRTPRCSPAASRRTSRSSCSPTATPPARRRSSRAPSRTRSAAEVVGEKTFGTGTVLGRFDLSDGSSLRIGVERWLTRNGRPIWHEGLEPDVKVALPEDVQLLLPDDARGHDRGRVRDSRRTRRSRRPWSC